MVKSREEILAEFKLLDTINDCQQQPTEVKAPQYEGAFVIHAILHLFPILFGGFDQIIAIFFEQRYVTQMLFFLLVLEFWITKNITGKRMLGYRWFFAPDQYGIQRLWYQCRANPQHQDGLQPKLFWIVQAIYCIISFLFIFQAVFIIPNIARVQTRKISLNTIILASGVANIFYFLSVSGACEASQMSLRRKIGTQNLRKLGLGSITNYV